MSGVTRPNATFINVDLPAPFGPTSARKLTGAEVERNVLQHLGVTEADADVMKMQGGRVSETQLSSLAGEGFGNGVRVGTHEVLVGGVVRSATRRVERVEV